MLGHHKAKPSKIILAAGHILYLHCPQVLSLAGEVGGAKPVCVVLTVAHWDLEGKTVNLVFQSWALQPWCICPSVLNSLAFLNKAHY